MFHVFATCIPPDSWRTSQRSPDQYSSHALHDFVLESDALAFGPAASDEFSDMNSSHFGLLEAGNVSSPTLQGHTRELTPPGSPAFPLSAHAQSHSPSLAATAHLPQLKVINSYRNVDSLYHYLDALDLPKTDRVRPGWDEYFMTLASLASMRSNCMKRRVGAILVRNNRIVATGFVRWSCSQCLIFSLIMQIQRYSTRPQELQSGRLFKMQSWPSCANTPGQLFDLRPRLQRWRFTGHRRASCKNISLRSDQRMCVSPCRRECPARSWKR